MDEDSPDALAEQIATSVRDHLDEDSSTRRRFLGRSALAGGTLLTLGGGAGVALAGDTQDGQSGNETGNQTDGELSASFDDVAGTDIDVLNYALSLEHLENAFYAEALSTFDQEEFNNADAVSEYSAEGGMSPYQLVETIGAHEAAHVDVLTQAVELLGGTPSMEATYDFGIETPGDVIALGQVFENTGVAAYAGAAGFIESPDLLGAALSIHSVEARHAALLNDFTGQSPFPNAFDPASSQQEVLDAVSGFIVSSGGGDASGAGSGSGGNGTGDDSGNSTDSG